VVTFTHGDVAMVGNYPKDIRARINAKGGYKKMPVDGLWALPPARSVDRLTDLSHEQRRRCYSRVFRACIWRFEARQAPPLFWGSGVRGVRVTRFTLKVFLRR
jgi:hypothetical protein